MTGKGLHAGSARRTITPNGPVPLSGYGPGKRISTDVHDDLAATALVLSDGGTTVGIVSLDLLNVSRSISHRLRHRLVRDGPLDEVILAATHTHAGPYIPAPAIDVNPLLEIDEDVTPIVATIREDVEACIRAAYDSLSPATVRVGRAENDTTPINRRATGGVNGSVRVPTGSVDPECWVLDVETDVGEETLLYDFACHPVCTTPGETLVSADWPGYTREHVEEATGATTLFCNGATGDVNPRDRYAEDREGSDVYEYMAKIGQEVGETVLAARDDARDSDPITAPLTVDSTSLHLPVKSTPDERTLRKWLDELDEELERLRSDGNETAAARVESNRTYVRELLAIAGWDAVRLPTRTTYLEFGPVGLLGLPGEIFAEDGLEYKDRARVDSLLPIGYVDGYIGYVPPLNELENGGYEVQTAKLAPEGLERLRSAAIDLVADH